MFQGTQMKLNDFLFLAIFFCAVFFPALSSAKESRGITILFTGFVEGNIDPVRT